VVEPRGKAATHALTALDVERDRHRAELPLELAVVVDLRRHDRAHVWIAEHEGQSPEHRWPGAWEQCAGPHLERVLEAPGPAMPHGVGMDEEPPGIDDQQPFQHLVIRLGPRVPGDPVEESEGVQDDVRDPAIAELTERDRDREDPRSDAVTE